MDCGCYYISPFISVLILDNKMSNELSFLDRLVQELLKSKHNNYSEECINFYIDDEIFSIEDIAKVHNHRQQNLKCSLIKHKIMPDIQTPNINSKCIVYMHGFGSSRLQALFLAQQLPKDYCLCIFDMSGSGKSEGEKITYGLKEQEDIKPVIDYLHKKKAIKEFVIWGRSMGAVAALLYAINHPSLKYRSCRKERYHFSAKQSLKNSAIVSKDDAEYPVILGLVLDSPFCNFRQVAKEIANKKLAIPSILLDIALKYVQQSFTKILEQSIGGQYNPFSINFDQKICISVPIIFLYSQKDEIIDPSHSQRIIRNMDSKYRKILINQYTHNQTRPPSAISEIFDTLTLFNKSQRRTQMESSFQMNHSLQKKRGIFVYTPSKQLKREQSPASSKFYQAVTIQLVRTEQVLIKSPRNRSNSKRNMITLQSKKTRVSKQLDTMPTENNTIGKSHALDIQIDKLLNRKLVDSLQQNRGLKMTRASKRFNHEKRRQMRLSNQKYLK